MTASIPPAPICAVSILTRGRETRLAVKGNGHVAGRTTWDRMLQHRSPPPPPPCLPRCSKPCKSLPALAALLECSGCVSSSGCAPGKPYFPMLLEAPGRGCIADGAACIVNRSIMRRRDKPFNTSTLLALRHRPAPLSESRLAQLFHSSRVALLLVGQAFRGPSHDACNGAPLVIHSQQEASLSYVRHVCEPLEVMAALIQADVDPNATNQVTCRTCNTSRSDFANV